jgi:hypothetical protein
MFPKPTSRRRGRHAKIISDRILTALPIQQNRRISRSQVQVPLREWNLNLIFSEGLEDLEI